MEFKFGQSGWGNNTDWEFVKLHSIFYIKNTHFYLSTKISTIFYIKVTLFKVRTLGIIEKTQKSEVFYERSKMD